MLVPDYYRTVVLGHVRVVPLTTVKVRWLVAEHRFGLRGCARATLLFAFIRHTRPEFELAEPWAPTHKHGVAADSTLLTRGGQLLPGAGAAVALAHQQLIRECCLCACIVYCDLCAPTSALPDSSCNCVLAGA